MKEISELQKHIDAYGKTREIYAQYRKLPPKKAARFYQEHTCETLSCQAAKRYFDSLEMKKLLSIQSLKQEYAALLAKNKKSYPELNRRVCVRSCRAWGRQPSNKQPRYIPRYCLPLPHVSNTRRGARLRQHEPDGGVEYAVFLFKHRHAARCCRRSWRALRVSSMWAARVSNCFFCVRRLRSVYFTVSSSCVRLREISSTFKAT